MDNYIDLPPREPGSSGKVIDWHGSPKLMANTGYQKGQALNPPQPFLPIPPSPATTNPVPATTQPVPSATQGCQSPDHDDPLTAFTLDQGRSATSDFISECQGVELSQGKTEGCTLYFNPCSKNDGAAAIDVILSVRQISWKDAGQSTWPDVQEMYDAVGHIMNDCDTDTTTKKWGGFKSVEVESGMRMYNVTANKDGQYPDVGTSWVTKTLTSGEGDCGLWDSSE